MSVTRSTQTQKDVNFLTRDEPKVITFKAELSDAKDKCDDNAVTGAAVVASPEEYDGLRFIDDPQDDSGTNIIKLLGSNFNCGYP